MVWEHSDPNLDPCGYRSLMVLQLAEKYYRKTGLYNRLIENRWEKNVRPKAAELVFLLKAGDMDYTWAYLSVAVQHNLSYLILPDKINLSSYKEDAFYQQASVKVTGKKPGEWIIRKGKSITYSVTMMNNASNPTGAALFLEYLLSPKNGLKVLKEMGQPPFEPARVPDGSMEARLPAPLKALVDVKN